MPAGANFGYSVATNSDYFFVSAYKQDYNGETEAGVVYVFDIYGNKLKVFDKNGKELSEFFADTATQDDHFGESVGMSNGYAIVGVPNDDDDGADSGSAYLYYLD